MEIAAGPTEQRTMTNADRHDPPTLATLPHFPSLRNRSRFGNRPRFNNRPRFSDPPRFSNLPNPNYQITRLPNYQISCL
jgi:hypothetical protein